MSYPVIRTIVAHVSALAAADVLPGVLGSVPHIVVVALIAAQFAALGHLVLSRRC